jgi:hypothetical protein
VGVELGRGDDIFLLTGTWHGPETAHYFWGGELDHRRCRWTGPHAGLRLPVRAETEYELRCDLHLPGESGPCELSVDGAPLAIVRTPGTHEVRARFVTARGRSCVEVAWRARAFVPRDHRGSPDERSLGVAVRQVELAESSASTAARAAPRVPLLSASVSRDAIAHRLTRRLERGAVMWCPTLDPPVLAAFLNEVVHRLHEILPGMRSAALVDGALDGIWATLFADRVLLYNTTSEPREKRLRLASLGGPEEITVRLAPHDLGVVPLRR